MKFLEFFKNCANKAFLFEELLFNKNICVIFYLNDKKKSCKKKKKRLTMYYLY